MSHTPGPWVKGGDFGDVVGADGERVIVWGLGIGHGQRDKTTEANARLMQAAPDLLEALEELLNGGSIWVKDEHIARDAIKKARGE